LLVSKLAEHCGASVDPVGGFFLRRKMHLHNKIRRVTSGREDTLSQAFLVKWADVFRFVRREVHFGYHLENWHRGIHNSEVAFCHAHFFVVPLPSIREDSVNECTIFGIFDFIVFWACSIV
jgi:hypothetical protein